MSPKKSKAEAPDELTFEQAYAELEAIVRQLEAGSIALEDALALFERGQTLAARCQAILDTATLKIQALTPEGTVPFEAEEA